MAHTAAMIRSDKKAMNREANIPGLLFLRYSELLVRALALRSVANDAPRLTLLDLLVRLAAASFRALDDCLQNFGSFRRTKAAAYATVVAPVLVKIAFS